MTIKIGDSLPAATLTESAGQDDGKNCPMPPTPVDIAALAAGKKIVIFGVPGAFSEGGCGEAVADFDSHQVSFRGHAVGAVLPRLFASVNHRGRTAPTKAKSDCRDEKEGLGRANQRKLSPI